MTFRSEVTALDIC